MRVSGCWRGTRGARARRVIRRVVVEDVLFSRSTRGAQKLCHAEVHAWCHHGLLPTGLLRPTGRHRLLPGAESTGNLKRLCCDICDAPCIRHNVRISASPSFPLHMLVCALQSSEKNNVVYVGKVDPDHECRSGDDDLGLGVGAHERSGLSVVRGPIECMVKVNTFSAVDMGREKSQKIEG